MLPGRRAGGIEVWRAALLCLMKSDDQKREAAIVLPRLDRGIYSGKAAV